MKKLILTLLLTLPIISSASYAEEINSLFGIDLYDNSEKFVSSNYINSNKVKNPETNDDYFDLEITDKIKAKSPYASKYWITIDSGNIIHSIYGHEIINNLDMCLEVQEDLLTKLEDKYQNDFEYWEKAYPRFKVYRYQTYGSLNNHYAMQCNDDYENSIIKRQIYLETDELLDAINKFYDSGL